MNLKTFKPIVPQCPLAPMGFHCSYLVRLGVTVANNARLFAIKAVELPFSLETFQKDLIRNPNAR